MHTNDEHKDFREYLRRSYAKSIMGLRSTKAQFHFDVNRAIHLSNCVQKARDAN